VHGEDRHAVRNGVAKAEVGLGDAHGIRKRAATWDDDNRRARPGYNAQDCRQPATLSEAAAKLYDRRRRRPSV
jgi:hypothetical protein